MTAIEPRPVFHRLPIRNFQDNPLVDAVTIGYDEKLTATGLLTANLWRQLDPLITPSKYLDWLASLIGMVDPYYDIGWADVVKRRAIISAQKIFSYRGTLIGLRAALDIHGFEYSIYSGSVLTLPFMFDAKFGSFSSSVFVRVPLKYPRFGPECREIMRAIDCYVPMTSKVQVCYDQFYLDFSVFGDPVF